MNDTNTPDSLTAADLDRNTNPGNVYMHRVTVCPPCAGDCHQGRRCPAHAPAEACTELGVESMWRYRRTMSTVVWGIALALMLVIVGYLMQTLYPLL